MTTWLPRLGTHQLRERPWPIGQPGRHRGRHVVLKRAGLPAEVEVSHVQRDRPFQAFQFLGETEGQPREPLHEGPHGQV